jgi:hypothetical protein
LLVAGRWKLIDAGSLLKLVAGQWKLIDAGSLLKLIAGCCSLEVN